MKIVYKLGYIEVYGKVDVIRISDRLYLRGWDLQMFSFDSFNDTCQNSDWATWPPLFRGMNSIELDF